MKQFILLSFFSIIISCVSAQNADCKVLLDSIKGTYTGECNNGKANGKGIAVGIATYDGDFKNGLPDGKGKYTWANGDFYYGGWKKGFKEGKGEIHRTSNGIETLITGYWKKDNYKGEYENPYNIVEMGSSVTYKNVQYLATKKNSVYFSMKTGVMATANTDNFQVTNGYFQRTNTTEMNMIKTIEFQDVQFPFHVKFNGVDRGIVDIEFFESGEWRVEIVF